jgi:hypothetical protein
MLGKLVSKIQVSVQLLKGIYNNGIEYYNGSRVKKELAIYGHISYLS